MFIGHTTNVQKRLHTYNAGEGPRKTKKRVPFILLKTFKCPDKKEALKLESVIKNLPFDEQINYENE